MLSLKELDLRYSQGDFEQVIMVNEPNVKNIEHLSWFRHHPIALLKRIQTPLGVDEELVQPIEEMAGTIFEGLTRAYLENNSPVMFCHDGVTAIVGRRDLRNEDKLIENPQDAGSHIVTINPVFLGSLSEEVLEALSSENIEIAEYSEILRQNLPENRRWIYAQTIGSKKLKLLDGRIHPHFTNLIFLEDNNESIRNLSHEKILIFTRMMMAKLGSMKNIIIPYRRTESEIIVDHAILGTMEGGHPMPTSLTDLAYELMAFGSSKEVGGYRVLKGIEIDKKIWEQAAEVKGMIDFGQLLGREGNISSPIMVRNLTQSQILGLVEEELLGYQRQAESALFAVIPKIKVRTKKDERLRWKTEDKMVKIVSNSGTTGAIKTNLTPADISPVLSVTDGKVDVIKVRGLKSQKTSVEAEELLGPLDEIEQVGISEDENGNLYFDINGKRYSVIRSGFHIHRGLESITIDGQQFKVPADCRYIESDDSKVIYMKLDISQFPHVGCGVDTMQNMSREAMKIAARLWREKSGKPQLVLVYVPNHGINGFEFFSEDENGIIPKNPYIRSSELIESGYIKFSADVPQVTFSEGQFPTYRYSIISPN